MLNVTLRVGREATGDEKWPLDRTPPSLVPSCNDYTGRTNTVGK
jgi:hypothetical protein